MNEFVWQWTPYLIPLTSGGILTLAFAILTWQRKEVRARRTTALLLGSISIWSLGFAMELVSGEPEAMRFWDIFQFLGNVFLPLLWAVFALLYTERWEEPVYPTIGLLLIFPAILLVLVFSNDSHGLVWNQISYEQQGGLLVRVKTIGVALWAFYTYAYTLILFGNFLLLQTFIRSRRLFRWQGTALIFGAVIPWAVSILHIAGFISSKFDHTPLILTFTGLTVFININRLWRGDVIPVAHRKILESIEDAVCVLDSQNRILELNPAAIALTGLPLAGSVGMKITKIWPEWKTLIDSQENLETSGHELLLQTPDGGRYYDVRFSPLVNWQGKLVSKVMVLRDITLRREAQAELETYATALEERNRGLLALQAASQAITSSLDLEKVLQSVNNQLIQLLSVPGSSVSVWDQETNTVNTLARVVPESWSTPPETSYPLDDYPATKRVLTEHICLQLTLSQADIDPGERDFMESLGLKTLLMLPLAFQNQVFGLVEIMDDRKERLFNPSELSLAQLLANQAAFALENADLYKQAQEELKERKRLQADLERYTRELKRSNEELQYFAYVASHDLREPLRMITSYLQLLARRYQGKLDQDADEFIHFAVDGAKRMEALIHGLLLYSRVDTRGTELTAVSCGEVVTQVLTNLKIAIEESGARVTYDGLPTILADPNQLNLLFQNLVANAIKYRREEPPEIRITVQNEKTEWIFCVEDNGIGFEPDQSGRVFMIFQRLHTQEEFSGLGIGLAICKKIVERHGGRIWAESLPGHGSRFYFTLPAEAKMAGIDIILSPNKMIIPARTWTSERP
jgi:PAS domain S-box-containing protein